MQVYQERPSQAEWRLWQRANRLWSDPNGQFYQALGPWTKQIHDQRQQHATYWHTQGLWTRSSHEYVFCTRQSMDTFEETSSTLPWNELPSDSYPVEAYLKSERVWVTKGKGEMILYGDVPPPATFEDFIRSLEETEILIHTRFTSDPFTVAAALTQGVRAVSDGSEWFHTQGAFGWALAAIDGTRLASGMGPA